MRPDEVVTWCRDRPCGFEVEKFLAVFKTLNEFEAQHRLVRGYGAFDPKDLPISEVCTVIAWLERMVR